MIHDAWSTYDLLPMRAPNTGPVGRSIAQYTVQQWKAPLGDKLIITNESHMPCGIRPPFLFDTRQTFDLNAESGNAATG